MKFLPPAFNTKDLKSKQSNKWRWAWLSECDTNGEKWGIWLKKNQTLRNRTENEHMMIHNLPVKWDHLPVKRDPGKELESCN